MAFQTTASKIIALGNGVTVNFPVPFLFYEDAHLVVSLVHKDTGVETPQTLTTHYTVSGAGDPAGGTVTFLTAPPATEYVVIQRRVPQVQTVDLKEGDKFPPDTVERTLDLLTMMVQEQTDKLSRAVLQSVTDTAPIGPLPPKADRTNLFFAFNANGDPIAAAPSNIVTYSLTPFVESLLDDPDAATFRNSLGLGSMSTRMAEALTDVTVAGDVDNTATGFFRLPQGTTAQRPTGAAGMVRYNSTLGKFEGYTTAWGSLGGGATGGGSDAVFMENDQTVNHDYTITNNKNALSVGPVSITDGVTVTVPSGSVWVVI